MSFEVAADAYGRFMGRFAEPLAVRFAEEVGLRPGQRVLDVGCGPGALAQRAVDLGCAVSAVDPSAPFVEAARRRLPGVDVRVASAEALPFGDASYEATAAQLVVHFMADPVAGLAEMARVTRPGGLVAACVWDHAGGTGPLSLFWRVVREVDPSAPDESRLPGSADGDLVRLLAAAGVQDARGTALRVVVPVASFEDWWEPYTLGVGPAGAWVRRASPAAVEAVRQGCADLLPPGGFEVSATAWCAVGSVPPS